MPVGQILVKFLFGEMPVGQMSASQIRFCQMPAGPMLLVKCLFK